MLAQAGLSFDLSGISYMLLLVILGVWGCIFAVLSVVGRVARPAGVWEALVVGIIACVLSGSSLALWFAMIGSFTSFLAVPAFGFIVASWSVVTSIRAWFAKASSINELQPPAR
jgi:hypothetical protein